MSLRAREFVESFIVEYEAPVVHESDDLTESKAFASSCYASAAIGGGPRPRLMKSTRIWWLSSRPATKAWSMT